MKNPQLIEGEEPIETLPEFLDRMKREKQEEGDQEEGTLPVSWIIGGPFWLVQSKKVKS